MQPQEIQQSIKKAVQTGKTDKKQAVAQLLDVLRQDKKQPDAWYWLGIFTADPARKVDAFRRALELRPNDATIRAQLEQFESAASTKAAPPPHLSTVEVLALAVSTEPDASVEADNEISVPAPSGGGKTPSAGDGATAGELASAAGELARAAVRETREKIKRGLEEVDYRGLGRAWMSALLFDSRRSYEVYRPYASVLMTTVILGAIFMVAPLLVGFILYLMTGLNLSQIDVGNIVRGLLMLVVGNVLFSGLLLLSIYAASHVTAFVARRQFESMVSGNDHYALSALYFAPLYLVSCGMMLVFTILARLFPAYYYGGYSPFMAALGAGLSASMAITMMLFTCYVVIQYIFSNVAIHRVRAMPGIILSLLFMGIQILVLAWTIPFLMAFITLFR